jgi:hypothetical protein
MKITAKTINNIAENIKGMLNEYVVELEKSADTDGKVSISLPVKMTEDGSNINVVCGISFVKSKVVDQVGFTVSEQQELFSEE